MQKTSNFIKSGLKSKPCAKEQGQAEFTLFWMTQGFELGLLGHIYSPPIATLLATMAGGNADDCREQSQPPSVVVGRIDSLPICGTPAIRGSRKSIDERTMSCVGIRLTTFDQVAQDIA